MSYAPAAIAERARMALGQPRHVELLRALASLQPWTRPEQETRR